MQFLMLISGSDSPAESPGGKQSKETSPSISFNELQRSVENKSMIVVYNFEKKKILIQLKKIKP
jgi:hypothetical protein